MAPEAANAQSPLDFKVKDIEGKESDLSQYKGKVVMIVNVASKCGLTPQYEQLTALYDKYKEQGLVILGFPANNFGGQEPGTELEIKQFCTDKYHVDFPMFSKISVKGEDQAPLYQFLTSQEKVGEFGGDIQWNFNKFLVGRDGKVIARFEPKVKPDDAAVTQKLEAALKMN
ncbi:MAG: glutathione peroxidase [Candidatus Hydrogenedentes bacterium]|nr:glutathione peroxidase [Candidatus Hydrogenedentota bacterium]MBI3119279.1 glutathione peroxidase [Candidatus Hydrogenedentota bacterium]